MTRAVAKQGFTMIYDDVMRRRDLKSVSKCVYGYICRKAQGDRLSIGTRLLAGECGTTFKQVARAIEELERGQLLRVIRGTNGQRSSYIVLKACHIVTLSKPKSVSHSHGACHIVTEACHIDTRKRQRPTETKKPPTPLPSELDTPDFREAWAKWIQHRVEIHKALKPTGIKSLLKRLAKKGPEESIRLIDKSVDNGWQGLIFDETSTKPRTGRVEPPVGPDGKPKYPKTENNDDLIRRLDEAEAAAKGDQP